MGKRILAFDVSNIAHRAWHNKVFKKFTTRTGEPSGHVFGAFQIIRGCIKRQMQGGRKPICWFALDGSPSMRRKIYADYKKNRSHDVPVNEVERMVRLFPGVTWSHPKLEADDILGMMASKKFLKTNKLTIISGDHDMWQLLNSEVEVWDRDHYIDRTHVFAEFGVAHPKGVALYKALFGDGSDDVPPAVPNLIKRPWIDLINENSLRTPTSLLNALGETRCFEGHGPIKQAVVSQVVDTHWKEVRRNWKLVKLRREPVKVSKLTKDKGETSSKKLVAYLKKYECLSLVEVAKTFF